MSEYQLVLDLDDTVIPWGLESVSEKKEQTRIVHELLDYCDENAIDYAVNTARTVRSFFGLDESVKRRLKNKPYCHRRKGQSVEEAKEECMIRLASGKKRKNVILMDDRKENCDKVKKANFDAIHITPNGQGITERHMRVFKQKTQR